MLAADVAVNRRFYDSLWSGARLVRPHRFTTWPVIEGLARAAPDRLEVAPGLRPRLPLPGTYFLDISHPALSQLRAAGGHAVLGSITRLPFRDARFDLVCACDVIEHVDDDQAAFAELARVTRPGAALLVSVPLHPGAWTAFDTMVGHRRRYEPAVLAASLARAGFAIRRSAAFGLRPRSTHLVGVGMWFLEHRKARAMRWYNSVFMPLALRFAPALKWRDGFADADETDEIALLCERHHSASRCP